MIKEKEIRIDDGPAGFDEKLIRDIGSDISKAARKFWKKRGMTGREGEPNYHKLQNRKNRNQTTK